jgi:hypothetical protein
VLTMAKLTAGELTSDTDLTTKLASLSRISR